MRQSSWKWVGLGWVLLASGTGWTQSAWRKMIDANGHVTYTNAGLPPTRPPGRYVLSPRKYRAFEAYIDALAREHGLSKKLILAVIAIESDFQTRALSPKGAIGLMQLLPETARLYGVRNLWDPYENLRAGVAHLAYLVRRYRGNLGLALAAYNAGEDDVDRYGGIPPFAETRTYVKKVLEIYDQPQTHVYRFEDEKGVLHYAFEAPDPQRYRNIRRIPLTTQLGDGLGGGAR
ncbi:MAG: lytic transglycosylase domain-containing protein [Acidobacteria bacterium]|nr:lytic transglycosylase domain-containing protein [Acidobacteriota bacterium]MDW7983904.1 lytic transglycosylase domain-containing protein [Acidobacteriota bacterium]